MNRPTARLVSALLLFLCSTALYGQQIAMKSNLLYDATSTFNLGIETGLSSRWSLDFSASYNPWTFSGNKKMKHFFVQPEVRYWFCETFNGHFVGAHLIGGVYNVGGVSLPGLNKDYRYEGTMLGAGLTYGYQWMIGKRWSIEAALGVGYVYTKYDKYECKHCGDKLESKQKNGFLTPTKAAFSIVYFIK